MLEMESVILGIDVMKKRTASTNCQFSHQIQTDHVKNNHNKMHWK